MNFETPLTIDVLPVYEDFLEKYKKPFAAKLVYECSLKIYYRTIFAIRQDNKCIWCECEMTHERKKHNSTTIEHMIPRTVGGADDPENYTVACARCNSRRGHMPAEEFRAFIAAGKLDAPKKKKKSRPSQDVKNVRRARARRFASVLDEANKGLSVEERREANANRPVEVQYEMLKKVAALGDIDARTKDKIRAIEAFLSGAPNTFVPGTRLWRQYERFAVSPRLEHAA